MDGWMMHVYVYVYVYIYICIQHTYMHTYVCRYIYIYIHAYIHIYIYIRELHIHHTCVSIIIHMYADDFPHVNLPRGAVRRGRRIYYIIPDYD